MPSLSTERYERASDSPQPAKATLRHMHSRDELFACHALVSDLWPGTVEADIWIASVADMKLDGYRLLGASVGGRVVALAGYRVVESLLLGRTVQVEDFLMESDADAERRAAALVDELDFIGRDECCERMVIETSASSSSIHPVLRQLGLLGTPAGFTKSLEKTFENPSP